MDNTIKITTIVLTYNEEKRIKDVLLSLKKFDDIIVLDKSSTDMTREIAIKYGAKIIQVPYYNNTTPASIRKMVKNKLYEIQENEWIFSITSSDIIHNKLYDNMISFLYEQGDMYDVLDIPLYRYSFGIEGKHTYFGKKTYIGSLFRRSCFSENESTVHEDMWKDERRVQLMCEDGIGIYHLTHANLATIMDRHWRYSVQYVEDYIKKGKTRKDIMKYSIKESIKMCLKFFVRRIYKSGWEGVSQCMMLVMYNAMIYLNAYFSEENEQKISEKYQQIKEMCKMEEK